MFLIIINCGDKTDRSSYFLCKVPFTSIALFTRSWPTLMLISLKQIIHMATVFFIVFEFIPREQQLLIQ
jgi:hypothetical protein